MTAIVLGWGLGLLPLGLRTPLWAALVAFFVAAVIWGPWMSLSMAVFQDASPPAALAQVIAARGALLILAAPLGAALGGPIVAAAGARGTLLASAVATIVLGLVTTAVLVMRYARKSARRSRHAEQAQDGGGARGGQHDDEERGLAPGQHAADQHASGAGDTGEAVAFGQRGGGRQRGEQDHGGDLEQPPGPGREGDPPA
jgi:MFS family permease